MNNIPDGYPKPEDDATGLRMDVGFQSGQVIINMSKPVMHLTLPPHSVRSLAIALLQNAEMAEAEQAKAQQLSGSRIP